MPLCHTLRGHTIPAEVRSGKPLSTQAGQTPESGTTLTAVARSHVDRGSASPCMQTRPESHLRLDPGEVLPHETEPARVSRNSRCLAGRVGPGLSLARRGMRARAATTQRRGVLLTSQYEYS